MPPVGSDNRLVVVMTVAVVGFFGGLVLDGRLVEPDWAASPR
jgi:hypothetical protein